MPANGTTIESQSDIIGENNLFKFEGNCLTESQIQDKVRLIFEEYDKNNDGKLSLNELLKEINLKMSKPKCIKWNSS